MRVTVRVGVRLTLLARSGMMRISSSFSESSTELSVRERYLWRCREHWSRAASAA